MLVALPCFSSHDYVSGRNLNRFHARSLDWKPMKGTPYAVPRHSKNGSGLDPSAGEPTETSPTFSLSELKAVVSTLTFGRCAGADGIEAEMFDYTGEDLLQCLMDIFNRMIAWYRTVSRCYQKQGVPRNQAVGDQYRS